jgi:hypothetical protein
MAHTLKFNSTQPNAIHQHNIMESLAYRLSVARATRNTQLIERLEQERQQLAANTRAQGLRRFVAFCGKAISGVTQIFWWGSTLQVREFNCGSDRWWYAFDPSTGEFLYADSEIELQEQIQDDPF